MNGFRMVMVALACIAIVPRMARADISLSVGPSGYITSTCYTKADAEAEQALRIRSGLMVIGLNCQSSRFRGTPENLYAIYRQFVADHGSQFAAYEKQMLDYFIRSGSTDPETSLSNLSQALGNDLSLYVTQMRPDMFCYKFSPSLLQVRHMSDGQFTEWAVSSYGNHPATHPMCQ